MRVHAMQWNVLQVKACVQGRNRGRGVWHVVRSSCIVSKSMLVKSCLRRRVKAKLPKNKAQERDMLQCAHTGSVGQ